MAAELKPIDVICQPSRDGKITPMKIRVIDEDGEYQEYKIKGYNIIMRNNIGLNKKRILAARYATRPFSSAKAAGADLFEIVPEQIYTSADLNWQDKQSRSSVEMNDSSSRPAISSKVENISQYSHVFVGFPVWWYREPSIIDTFMESYDWNGITVIPFCTSGGSGLGDAGKNMQALGKGAKVIEGKRLSGNASETELKVWADQIL